MGAQNFKLAPKFPKMGSLWKIFQLEENFPTGQNSREGQLSPCPCHDATIFGCIFWKGGTKPKIRSVHILARWQDRRSLKHLIAASVRKLGAVFDDLI